jgi:hypothetical protein
MNDKITKTISEKAYKEITEAIKRIDNGDLGTPIGEVRKELGL